MHPSRILGLVYVLAIVMSGLCHAASYYVTAEGNDNNDGRASSSAWKTCSKVNATKFEPGDSILFQSGGVWREQLKASSDGSKAHPITYSCFGKGQKPCFLGSDILQNAKFISGGNSTYTHMVSSKVDAVLQDHVFVPSLCANNLLTITVPNGNPATDGKSYTACVRGNLIFSNGKSFLTFDNLIVDETAGQIDDGAVQGYGVRIEGGTDVTVSNCEANHCGRHNFGVINSTNFHGQHLKAAYAQPKTPGGNSFYVSYSDANAKAEKCIHEWNDITAQHMEDGNGGQYGFFVSHGDHQGLITMTGAVASTKLSFMSSPVMVKNCTLTGNASIENFGAGIIIDGVRLSDVAAIDQWASEGIIQNCIAEMKPAGGGPTGYSTAILLRDKARKNIVRFNTCVTSTFNCLVFGGNNDDTQCYGNIMQADANTIQLSKLADIIYMDFNFYSPACTIAGMRLKDWQSKGHDTYSLSGDPKFADPTNHAFRLQNTSPCVGNAKLQPAQIPAFDFNGKSRNIKGADMGAVQVTK